MIVTIDGPAGTGKSTVARRLAERLGFSFLDTGAMYRAVAAACLSANMDLDDVDRIAARARSVEIHFDGERTFVDGTDMTSLLRTSATTEAASRVAQIVGVREALVEQQRKWGRGRDLVSEGRDQGTVAFPEAECKFYLDASPEVRARRRQQELEEAGRSVPFAELLAEQTLRDERDRNRAVAPLRPADDAQIIDTSTLSIENVIERLESIVRQRTGR